MRAIFALSRESVASLSIRLPGQARCHPPTDVNCPVNWTPLSQFETIGIANGMFFLFETLDDQRHD
jgi:hypothetical protein